MIRSPALFALLVTLAAQPVLASDVEIDGSRSIFAVVTHKGGLGSGLAHNHLVTAPSDGARPAFDPEAPLAAELELRVAAEDLEVDDAGTQKTWYPRLEELGILDEPFGEVSDKDRAKIRKAMLSDEQLDSAEFPKIEVRVTAVAEEPSTAGDTAFSHAATVALTVHGETAESKAAARWELDDGVLTIEAVASFRFTDFGIKPYSAAFGLVKNLDEFHVFLHLVGRMSDDPAPGD